MDDSKTLQVRLALVLVVLLFADIDASHQLQKLVGSLLQVVLSIHKQTNPRKKKERRKETNKQTQNGRNKKTLTHHLNFNNLLGHCCRSLINTNHICANKQISTIKKIQNKVNQQKKKGIDASKS